MRCGKRSSVRNCRISFRFTKMDLESAFQQLAMTEGLTMMQMRILHEIRCSEKPTIGAVSRLMGDKPWQLLVVVQAAGDEGATSCAAAGRSDERVVFLQLSPLGTVVVEKSLERMLGRLQPIVENLAPEQIETMRQGMAIMRDLMKQLSLDLKEG